MKSLFRRFFIVIPSILGAIAIAAPEDMSIDAYDRVKQQIDREIDRKISAEFRSQEEELQQLSSPFKTGDEVTVTLVQGGRHRQVSGTFRGIKGQSVEIGERIVLLSDLNEMDRQRLMFGDQVQMLQLKINQIRKRLEDGKQHRKDVLVKQKLNEAGYTKAFFKKTIPMGRRYWFLGDLADRKISIKVEPTKRSEFTRITVRSKLDTAVSSVIFLDKDPVYCNVLATAGETIQEDSVWAKASFRVFTSDLGDKPKEAIRSKLKILLVKKDVGSWYLKPKSDKQPSKETDADVSYFTFRVIKSTIKDYTRAIERELANNAQASVAYQQKILDSIAKREQEAELHREKRRQQREKAAEVNKRAQAEKQAIEDRMRSIDTNYAWLTTNTAKKGKAIDSSSDRVISTNTFDDINAPSRIDDDRVIQFTEWERVSGGDRALSGKKYRLLKVAEKDGSAKYTFFYQASTTNSEGTMQQRDIAVSVKFSNDSEVNWSNTFKLSPSWSGRLVAARELTSPNIEYTIKAVTIDPM